MAVNRKPGSGGRRKNVTSGGGGVRRRGSAISSNNRRPVGKSDGYSRKNSQSSSFGGFSGGSGSGNRASFPTISGSSLSGCLSLAGSLGAQKLLKSKYGKIIMIAIAVIVLFYVVSSCTGGNACAGASSGSGMDMTSCLSMTPSSTFTGVAGTNSAEHSADLNVSASARTKYCNTSSSETVTVMIYMCATDLESKYGMATKDIQEMLGAKIGSNVNVIVETGGCSKWKNDTISSSTNEIWRITSAGMQKVADLGKQSMVNPSTLTNFIKFCSQNYPADRNILIFWDHGGGSVSGFGYDETSNTGSLTLDKLDSAIGAAGVKFDFIGFDACLMATLETALVMEDYADYLIASEETEPGCGWYYTNWLTSLSKNTKINTVTLGKEIIDDFVDECYRNSPTNKTTLSIVDLAELDGTAGQAFTNFAASVNSTINTDYKIVSNARSSTKEFSSGINQCDLINLCENLNTAESNQLAAILKNCVKYNRTSSNIGGANGISIYFPYGKSGNLDKLINTYNKIGMDSAYTECVRSFANVSAGGQIISGGIGSQESSLFGGGSDSLLSLIGMLGGSGSSSNNTDLIGTLLPLFLGNSSSSNTFDVGQLMGWFSSDKIMAQQSYYENNYLDPASVIHGVDNSGKTPVLKLTDEEWELVQDIELNVFYDDGTGYIDLGMDNVYEFDDNSDLLLGYDGTWLYLNDHVVSYYMESYDVSGDNYVITGRIPILLNGELMDLIVQFDNENENGIVVGARINYDGATSVEAKGLVELKNGDVIDFLCDYYTYDGVYSDSYMLGEQMTVNGNITISNKSVMGNCRYSYCLTDIYGNELWTPSMEYVD
ncbi:MAG: peptidase C11 [Clostridia bacterium]|nr:peptidase C11 [Clostridia bacterium]